MDKQNLASQFTRTSLSIQQSMCQALKDIGAVVYVYDGSGYFEAAQNCVYNDIRYKMKDGKIAILSIAAQQTFKTINNYMQFSINPELKIDAIGVFLILS